VPAYVIPTLPTNPYPLGRHVNHDDRSLTHAFAARPEAFLTIQSVTWTRRAPILDQGQLGSCTGNAAAGWVGTDNALRQGNPRVTEDDAVGYYEAATLLDPYPGSYPPDDTGSDGLSVTKVLEDEGLVDSYSHGFSLNDLRAALQSTPVLIGIPWYEQMFEPSSRGYVTIGGALAGGHEVVVDSLDEDMQSIGFANSWSASWGQDGWGRMTFATVEQLLSEDGDVTVPHALVVSPIPPEPVPPSPDNPGCLKLWKSLRRRK